MQSRDIREKFLKFFEQKGHTRVASSSLIPAADPTLLFTNAGMVQFKDCFLGLKNPGYQRATTSQKCVRAGGKHNDLENVGITPRHHTFFEMLGNFSFGDYFKEDAIGFAWEFLTRVVNLPKERLRITVFETDDEAAQLWKKQGVREDWIYRLGEKDNFWAMGDTGPCGPCTEIHFDWGEEYGKGDPTDNSKRFLEIWNLVFMQFNRDSSGKLTPLPKPSVDTGAGLERFCAVLQGTYNNYETDLFLDLIKAIAKTVEKTYEPDGEAGVSMRVIADHMRSGVFLLTDGVVPSNEGRGYVLRRILRRAIRHGKKLGQEKPFLHTLIPAVIQKMGDVFPELNKNEKTVSTLLKEEEEKFHETLHRGMGLLEESIQKAKQTKNRTLPGEVTFKLYDTFGFPVDLVEVICTEHGLSVDQKGFDALMEKQRSQSTWISGNQSSVVEQLQKELPKATTQFLGYDQLEADDSIEALFSEDGKPTDKLTGTGFAVFKKTPFYAEGGGQVGDQGLLSSSSVIAKVDSTFKIGSVFFHRVSMQKDELKKGASVHLSVDRERRQRTAVHHTATHLLHAALRNVLGDRVKQAGSLVDPEYLRFDFTYPRGLTTEEKTEIERLVNEQIFLGSGVEKKEMPYEAAIKSGALAFFDEKYGDRVRVVTVGGNDAFSVELCGGTHLSNSAEIGLFKITSESSVASGVRRITALGSKSALSYFQNRHQVLEKIEEKFAARADETLAKLDSLIEENKNLKKQNESLRLKAAQGGSGSGGTALWEKSEKFGALTAVIQTVSEGDPKVLRTLVDQVRDKLKEKTVVCLGAARDGKVVLCVGVTKDLTQKLNANTLIQVAAKEVGGTGGGRPDFAQAGGTETEKIPQALSALRDWLKKNPWTP